MYRLNSNDLLIRSSFVSETPRRNRFSFVSRRVVTYLRSVGRRPEK